MPSFLESVVQDFMGISNSLLSLLIVYNIKVEVEGLTTNLQICFQGCFSCSSVLLFIIGNFGFHKGNLFFLHIVNIFGSSPNLDLVLLVLRLSPNIHWFPSVLRSLLTKEIMKRGNKTAKLS